MFITLKTSKNQNAIGMEQVASRDANSSATGGASEIRENNDVPIKRPACLACKIKKVRCTGQRQSCDRCRTRAIRCVMPTFQKKASRKSGLLDDLTQEPARLTTNQSSEARRLPEDAAMNQPLTAEPTMTGAQNTTGRQIDSGHYQHGNQDVYLGCTQAPGSNTSLLATDCSADLDRICAAPTSSSLLKSPLQSTGLPPLTRQVTPPTPIQESGCVPDSFCNSKLCCCIENSATVLQRLEDDEFNITGLSIEGVVQLQKWVMFQCCLALDCSMCCLLPRVQTLVVVICDRLTEIFECLCKRFHSSAAGLNWPESLESHSVSSSSIVTGTLSTNRHAQLYCSATRGPAELASCNSAIFSNIQGDNYIPQEQLHMMRALLNLQIEHFRSLLNRVHGVSQDSRSEARQAKVKTMMARLDTAGTQINRVLSLVL
ncbi:hypothetical protein GGI42DRAFT_278857 [Trichoderma sp. SZMC 28013]